jgi:hypothetical protein
MAIDCILSENHSSGYGGGAQQSTLSHCQLNGNTASSNGGGADVSKVYGCVLNTNLAGGSGGGIYNCTASNCLMSGNAAVHDGGGACISTAYNCVLFNNSAVNGGGSDYCTLNNCTVTGNTATYGGGSYSDTLRNCIIYFNKQPLQRPDCYNGLLNYCCTLEQPTSGFGNITNDPVFVNPAGADYRLNSNSPCINTGNNAYVSGTNDLDGNPRIVGGTVDIGAYEYQTPSSILSYAWAQQYGLPTDGSADNADTDGDGMSNFAEWKSYTNPTNSLSLLQLAAPAFTNSPNGIVVTWQSVTNVTYYLQRSSDLAGTFSSLQSNLVGQANSTSYTDTTATNDGPYFYRVGVQ